MNYEEVQTQSGLQENVCFNVLQALVIRSIVTTDGIRYRLSDSLSPLIQEEINGIEAKQAECLEMIEAVIDCKGERVFRFQKIALEPRDEKIFLAMLSNLESFLIDSHKKASGSIPVKHRKVIFWGVGEVNQVMNQLVAGR
jgi:hypothetical protein